MSIISRVLVKIIRIIDSAVMAQRFQASAPGSAKGATRLGDDSAGHDGFPPTPSIQCSPNVFANSKGIVRQGDAYQIHCNPVPICHQPFLASGSIKVFVNSKEAGRIGDPLTCGDSVGQGSPNVFIGP